MIWPKECPQECVSPHHTRMRGGRTKRSRIFHAAPGFAIGSRKESTAQIRVELEGKPNPEAHAAIGWEFLEIGSP